MPSRTDLLFWVAAATVAAKKASFCPRTAVAVPTDPHIPGPPETTTKEMAKFQCRGLGGGGGRGGGKWELKKIKQKQPHTQPRPPPTPQPSAWHNYSRSLSMAALRMRVTRNRRASGCWSTDAAVPSSSGKGAGETASRIPAKSHLHTPARQQPSPGRRGQEGASPAMSAAGGTTTPTGAACCSRSWQGARPSTAVDLLLLFLLHLPFPPHTHAPGLSILS